jgi:tetratricopeptide (TPR) repeat protein
MEQVSLRDYCRQASSLIAAGESGRAIRIIRHILRRYPRHVESYRLLGQALLLSASYDEAATQFRRVLSADPEDAAARVGLAKAYEARGDLDKALWQIHRAAEILPGDPELRSEYARLVRVRRDDALSEQLETTRAALGRIHARRGIYPKAIQELRAVLEQDPDQPDVQASLAEVLWRAGRHEEAADVCHTLLEKLPNALKPNLIVGAWCDKSGRQEAAQPHFSLAQELDPENLVAEALLGDPSLLRARTVPIEPLPEEEPESISPPPPAQPAVEPRSETYEEKAASMSDVERPDEEFELPDWLQGVGDDLLEEEKQPGTPPVSSTQETVEDDETPTWLRSLLARSEAAEAPAETLPAEAGDMPDWMRELRPEVSGQAPTQTEPSDWEEAAVPDFADRAETEEAAYLKAGEEETSVEDEGRELWERILSEEGIDLGLVEEAPPPEAAGMTPEEWLRSTADLDQPRSRREPEAEAPTAEEPEAPAPEVEVEEDELPDWLKEFQQSEPEAEAEEGTMPAISEMEEDRAAVAEPTGKTAEDSDIPDWLREMMTDETTPAGEAETGTFPAVPVEETGLPDWLRDSEAAAAEPAPMEEEAALPEAAAGPAATADEGRELWERILAEEGIDLGLVEEAPPPEAAGMTPEEWLRSTADLDQPRSRREPEAEAPTAEEPEAPAPEAEELALPAWPEDFEEVPGEETMPSADVEVEVEEFPDWLRETPDFGRAEVEVEHDELPDWLGQVAAGEPISDEEAPAPAELAAELPNWLRELQEPAKTEAAVQPGDETAAEKEPALEAEAEELADWLREPAAAEGELEESEAGLPPEMPEWLSELEAGEVLLGEEDLGEALELEPGQMPEWLGEIMAGEPSFAESWPPEVAQAEAEEERIPDWLRDFRQTEEAEIETTAAVEEQGRVEAPQPELPDWLARLREGVPEAEPEVEEFPPAEEEIELLEEEAAPETTEPEWLVDLVGAEDELAELEEEALPMAAVAPAEEEIEPAPEVEAAPLPVAAEEREALSTRELEELRPGKLPKDPAARLSLARDALNAGDWSEALAIYGTLVNASELLDSVIENLQVGLRRHPDDAAGYTLLGDACMKDGRLHDALKAYRTALSKL